jgi:hypothetical protein
MTPPEGTSALVDIAQVDVAMVDFGGWNTTTIVKYSDAVITSAPVGMRALVDEGRVDEALIDFGGWMEAVLFTKYSDHRFKGTQEFIIYSDVAFNIPRTITLNSNAQFYAVGSSSGQVDVALVDLGQVGVGSVLTSFYIYHNSDSRYKKTQEIIKTSDANFWVGTHEKTFLSDSRFLQMWSQELYSDSRFIKSPYIIHNSDSRFWLTKEISKTSNAEFWHGLQTVQKLSDATFWKAQNIRLPISGSVARYDMETTVDGKLADLSGNGNDGTLNGGIQIGQVGGVVGGATEFDGVDDDVKLPDVAIPSTTSYTVEFWVKRLGWDSRSNYNAIMGWGLTGQPKFEVAYRHNLNTFYFGGWGTDFDTGVNFPTGTWYHIAVVVSSNVAKMYINTVDTGMNINVSSVTKSELYLGRTIEQNGNLYDFNGNLDEVAIYDRALTVDEIGVLYNGSLVSNARFLITRETTRESNTRFRNTYETQRTTDSLFWQTNSITHASNALFKFYGEFYKDSNALFKNTYTQSLQSDTDFHLVTTINIASDCVFAPVPLPTIVPINLLGEAIKEIALEAEAVIRPHLDAEKVTILVDMIGDY